jgi:glutathione S-transferase
MKLYFHPLSGNSRRVLLVATHLHVPLERVLVDITKGEQKGAPHLERNPNGKVPVLDDNGFVLWESRAIIQYLAGKVPGQTLLPDDPQGRADVQRWLFWCAAHNGPVATTLVQENFVKPLMGRPVDAAELARGEAAFHQNMAVLDPHLATNQWMARDHLTLADFSLAASFALAGPAKFPIGDYKHVLAWLDRIQALDVWKQTQPS